jgi:hypothetical protein
MAAFYVLVEDARRTCMPAMLCAQAYDADAAMTARKLPMQYSAASGWVEHLAALMPALLDPCLLPAPLPPRQCRHTQSNQGEGMHDMHQPGQCTALQGPSVLIPT